MTDKLSRRSALTATLAGVGALAASSVGLAGDKKRRQQCCCCQTPVCYSDTQFGIRVAGTVCPQFKWADWGSYCSYYALLCDETWPTNFDAACDHPTYQGCAADCPLRFNIISKGREHKTRHGQGPNTRLPSAVRWGQEPDKPMPINSDVKFKKMSDHIAIEFPVKNPVLGGATTIKAQLAIFHVQVKNKKSGQFAVGQEFTIIGNNAPAEIESIANDEVLYYDNNPHVVCVMIGTVEYQVVTATNAITGQTQ